MARLILILIGLIIAIGLFSTNLGEQDTPNPGAYAVVQGSTFVASTHTADAQVGILANAAATNSAFHNANAVATLESIGSTATAAADGATRQAEQDVTATALHKEATAGAIRATERSREVRATDDALAIQATRDLYHSRATATVSAAAAAGTAAAIHRIADMENQLAVKEIERIRIANASSLSEIRIREMLVLLLVVVLIVAVLAGMVYAVVVGYGRHIAAGPHELPPHSAGTSGPRLVPQQPQQPALLPDVVHLPEQLPAGKIGLGTTPGRQVWYSQKELGDILGAGIKGSGKSSLVRSLAYQARIHQWDVYLSDAEGLTFDPDTWGQVATSSADVESMLAGIFSEFDRRLDLFRQAFAHVRQELPLDEQFFVEDLENYAKAARRFSLEPLRPMMLAWDEANNHIGSSRRLDEAVHELLRRNRKPGMTVAIFGHTWHAKQVSSAIFTNLTRRICLRCDERTSRVVLGNTSAAKLPRDKPGQAIMQDGGQVGRFQTYYLPAARILRDVTPGGRSWQPDLVSDSFELQAEVDANSITHLPLGSRRQVAMQLAGFDNGAAYERADAALGVLAGRGISWAADLLEAAPTTI